MREAAHRRPLCSLVALCVGASACSGCKEEQAPTVRMDAAREPDAPGDVQEDIDRAPPDAGWQIDEAGWARPPWLPAGVQVVMSTRPSEVIPPLSWAPCGGTTAGCLQLQPGAREIASQCPSPMVYHSGAYRVGEGVYLAFRGYVRIAGRRWWYGALAPLEGPVAVAWASLYEGATLDTGLAVSLIPRNEASAFTQIMYGLRQPGDLRVEWTTWVRHGLDGRIDHVTSHFAADESQYITVAGSSDLTSSAYAFAELTNAALVYDRGPTPRIYILRGQAGAEFHGQPILHGDRLFRAVHIREDGHRRKEIWTTERSANEVRLLGGTSRSYGGFDTDGRSLVWVESPSFALGVFSVAEAEVWTAPYATRPEALHPRLLTRVAPYYFGTVHVFRDGRYLAGNGYGPFWLIDVATGAYRRLDALPADAYGFPYFLSPTEAGFLTRVRMGFGCETVMRVPLSAFGPEMPPRR